MKMCQVWEILQSFKSSCSSLGWKTSENEDWIEIGHKYHTFLCTRDVHPSSFKKIVSNRKFVVKEGSSYRVAEASYTAWLFSEKPSETLLNSFFEDPTSSGRIAIYDLSSLLEEKCLCFKMNFTDSPVFQEFERFLQNKLNVKLKPLSPESAATMNTRDFTIEESA
jgi:hypothetical protein